jgi:hypothetical protein
MIKRIYNFLHGNRDRQRIMIALAKGGAMMQARSIDLTMPETWEFSGFSQNGEDGILDVLRRQLKTSNRYFIEIGASDGIENNSSWLLIAEKYSGIAIDGNPELIERARRTVEIYSIGAEYKNMFVTLDSVKELRRMSFHSDPDIFSLDIDGNDYYIAKALIDSGFRPKIFVVEYNSVYGPEHCMTVKYRDDFFFKNAHSSELYYGVSIAGWRKFFEANGYRFVTVDRNGVNGFFVDPDCFDTHFLNEIKGIAFAENRFQYTKFRKTSEEQFKMIADQQFVSI